MRAPNLRFLEIIEENSYSQVMGEISAPLLTSFRYEGNIPFECSKVNLPMLEEVYLDIHKKLEPNNIYNEKRMVLKCVRMLQLLGNAKVVALTLDTLKVTQPQAQLNNYIYLLFCKLYYVFLLFVFYVL